MFVERAVILLVLSDDFILRGAVTCSVLGVRKYHLENKFPWAYASVISINT